jgi:hypothetical protein
MGAGPPSEFMKEEELAWQTTVPWPQATSFRVRWMGHGVKTWQTVFSREWWACWMCCRRKYVGWVCLVNYFTLISLRNRRGCCCLKSNSIPVERTDARFSRDNVYDVFSGLSLSVVDVSVLGFESESVSLHLFLIFYKSQLLVRRQRKWWTNFPNFRLLQNCTEHQNDYLPRQRFLWTFTTVPFIIWKVCVKSSPPLEIT